MAETALSLVIFVVLFTFVGWLDTRAYKRLCKRYRKEHIEIEENDSLDVSLKKLQANLRNVKSHLGWINSPEMRRARDRYGYALLLEFKLKRARSKLLKVTPRLK